MRKVFHNGGTYTIKTSGSGDSLNISIAPKTEDLIGKVPYESYVVDAREYPNSNNGGYGKPTARAEWLDLNESPRLTNRWPKHVWLNGG